MATAPKTLLLMTSLLIFRLFFSFAQANETTAGPLVDSQDDNAAESMIGHSPHTTADPTDPANSLLWLDHFHDSFSSVLDESALWLNDRFVDEENHIQYKGSKAWARVLMGWEPRSGELDKFPVKFKVKVKLPNLKQNINLVFSDDDNEEFNNLPLESTRPKNDAFDSKKFSAAIQLLHKASEHAYFRTRIGISDAQLYSRSSYRWKNIIAKKFTLAIEPSIEYYINDKFGTRLLTELSYFPNEQNEVRFTYSIWDRQTFDEPRWKNAIHHLLKIDDKSTLISGVLVRGVVSPSYEDEVITVSSRYRRHAIRSWLFFEVEPFVDFEREQHHDPRWGLALRVGGYFGYN